ncbi:MAG: uracil-DNA glycosylase family protein [Chloroflexota bacterium]|nr:uracil-DNA glycosylase family protein [Chloroflexota bacterium]
MHICTPRTTIELQRLHSEVLACRKCALAGHLWEAHPVAGGWATAQVMVIGQAPGVRSMVHGAHFKGPGGRLLREWIARGGIPHEDQERDVYLSSLTRCYPGPAPRGGAGDRKPSPAEIALCEPYLTRELELLDPCLVILVGGMAIERFLGKGPLRERVGTLIEAHGRHWLPLPHPSGVSRWLNDPDHKRLVDKALEKMRLFIESRMNRAEMRAQAGKPVVAEPISTRLYPALPPPL